MTHFWRLRKYLPLRHGQPCRVLCRGNGKRGAPRNILVEFEDGARVVSTRWAVRRLP